MVTLQTFVLGLLVVSVFTGLVTEGIKSILADFKINYHANTLAGMVSVFLSAFVGIGFILINGLSFNTSIIIYLIALVCLSWLCAMVGYDKVIQAIGQFKTYRKDE